MTKHADDTAEDISIPINIPIKKSISYSFNFRPQNGQYEIGSE